MMRKLVPIYSAAWRAAVVLLSVEIAAVSVLRYLTGGVAPPPPILDNAYANPFLILHVIGGVTALLVGPVQFVRRLRTGRPALHRLSGRLYLLACAIGAPAGFIIALGTTAGPFAAAGFATAALLWAAFTWLGWRAAVERQFAEHREWMLRSYGITATAITLRLMLPAAGLLGIPFYPAYRTIAWAAWLTNLALFEYHIRRTRRATARFATLAAAGA
jgi:uncharacterized membrane protein